MANIEKYNPLTARDLSKFFKSVQMMFSLTSEHEEHISYSLRLIDTKERMSEFKSFAEGELNELYDREQIDKFTRFTRLEKFNIVTRRFNRELRIKERDKKQEVPLLAPMSHEDEFLSGLKGKLKGAIRNMRACRDLAAANRERYKLLDKTLLMREIGIDQIDVSIIQTAIREASKDDKNISDKERDEGKYEADKLCQLYENKMLASALNKEANRRILMLKARKDSVMSMFSSSTSAVEQRIDESILDIEDRIESILEKEKKIYETVHSFRNKDWGKLKDWEMFKLVNENGQKTNAFSKREIAALEAMGGWDNIIKIFDQDRLDREYKKAAAIARNKKKPGMKATVLAAKIVKPM